MAELWQHQALQQIRSAATARGAVRVQPYGSAARWTSGATSTSWSWCPTTGWPISGPIEESLASTRERQLAEITADPDGPSLQGVCNHFLFTAANALGCAARGDRLGAIRDFLELLTCCIDAAKMIRTSDTGMFLHKSSTRADDLVDLLPSIPAGLAVGDIPALVLEATDAFEQITTGCAVPIDFPRAVIDSLAR